MVSITARQQLCPAQITALVDSVPDIAPSSKTAVLDQRLAAGFLSEEFIQRDMGFRSKIETFRSEAMRKSRDGKCPGRPVHTFFTKSESDMRRKSFCSKPYRQQTPPIPPKTQSDSRRPWSEKRSADTAASCGTNNTHPYLCQDSYHAHLIDTWPVSSCASSLYGISTANGLPSGEPDIGFLSRVRQDISICVVSNTSHESRQPLIPDMT